MSAIEETEHADARRNIAAAQRDVLHAVEKGWPEFFVEPPSKELTSGTCDSLTRQQIDMGVRAFVLACNLSGGAAGDVQLYDLLTAYLTKCHARRKINEVVKQARLPPDKMR